MPPTVPCAYDIYSFSLFRSILKRIRLIPNGRMLRVPPRDRTRGHKAGPPQHAMALWHPCRAR